VQGDEQIEKEKTGLKWIGLKMIGSNWLPINLDVIHKYLAVNDGFQSKRISLGDCKHLPVLSMDFDVCYGCGWFFSRQFSSAYNVYSFHCLGSAANK